MMSRRGVAAKGPRRHRAAIPRRGSLLRQRQAASFLRYFALIALAFVFVFPLLFMVVASFKPEAQIFSDLRSWRAFVPVGDLTLDHYRTVLLRSRFFLYAFNTIFITVVTVALTVLVNSMAAFVLQRLAFGFNHLVLVGIVALLIVPGEATLVPLLMLVSRLPWIGFDGIVPMLQWGWFNSYHVQIVPLLASVFFTYFFYQSFRDIPKEYDEAAYMDGATPWQVYWWVVLPLSIPAVTAVVILGGLGIWNAYVWPLMTVQQEAYRPLMVALQQFNNQRLQWGESFAFMTMITVPVIALYVLFQRQFASSMTEGGLKQ
jgi:multiple sugar transport system permease protein